MVDKLYVAVLLARDGAQQSAVDCIDGSRKTMDGCLVDQYSVCQWLPSREHLQETSGIASASLSVSVHGHSDEYLANGRCPL